MALAEIVDAIAESLEAGCTEVLITAEQYSELRHVFDGGAHDGHAAWDRLVVDRIPQQHWGTTVSLVVREWFTIAEPQ